MQKKLLLLLAVLLTACGPDPEPITEVPSKYCTSTPTGKTGVRTWTECVPLGKNGCASTVTKRRATEELETICRFNLTRDKS